MDWLRYGAVALAAYLLGSLPIGYLIVWLVKKVDIRTVGSGRTGGSNVLRAAGVLPAALTVVGDFAKGYGAVLLARTLAPEATFMLAVAGVLVVLGHDWSLFLGFRGGVGTMTSIGAALALTPLGAVVASAAALLVLARFRYSSLGSLTFAAVLILACLVGWLAWGWSAAPLAFALATGGIAAWLLKPNIARLRNGTERQLGQFIRPGKRDVDTP